MTVSSENYWNMCCELTQGASWQQSTTHDALLPYSRAVTWSRYPYRHILTEHATQEKKLLRPAKIVSRIFELAILSAERTDGTGREYTRYFVTAEAEPYMLDSLVGEYHDSIAAREVRRATNFMLDNSLAATNAEDVLRLETILDTARLDGVSELISKKV